MDFTTLGRTGLKVSVMGLGCGGHSRLGLTQGKSEANAIEVVQAALDLGINYIDTAEAYGTEGVVGQAIRSVKREDVIISTKKSLNKKEGKMNLDAAGLLQGLEANLKRLNTDYIDIYNLHGLRFVDYDYARAELVPALERARE